MTVVSYFPGIQILGHLGVPNVPWGAGTVPQGQGYGDRESCCPQGQGCGTLGVAAAPGVAEVPFGMVLTVLSSGVLGSLKGFSTTPASVLKT